MRSTLPATLISGALGVVSLLAGCGNSGSSSSSASVAVSPSPAAPSPSPAAPSPSPAASPAPSPSPSPSPSPLAVQPPSNYLYAAVTGNDVITTWALDPVTGIPSSPTDTQLVGPLLPGGPAFNVQSISVAPMSSIIFAAGMTTQATFPITMHSAILPIPFAGGKLTVGSVVLGGSAESSAVVVDPVASVVFTVDSLGNGKTTPGGGTVFGSLSGFTFASGTGVPTPGTSVAIGSQGPPVAAAADPTGTFLYAVNPTDETLQALGIDSGGFVAGTSPPAVSLTTPPNAVVVDAQGLNLYTGNADGTLSLFQITSPGTAVLALTVPVEPTGSTLHAQVLGVAVDPTGTFVVTANGSSNDVSLFQVGSVATFPTSPIIGLVGQPYAIPGATGNPTPTSVVFNGNGAVVYVANAQSNDVSALGVSAAGLTPLAGSPFALPTGDTTPVSLAVSQ